MVITLDPESPEDPEPPQPAVRLATASNAAATAAGRLNLVTWPPNTNEKLAVGETIHQWCMWSAGVSTATASRSNAVAGCRMRSGGGVGALSQGLQIEREAVVAGLTRSQLW